MEMGSETYDVKERRWWVIRLQKPRYKVVEASVVGYSSAYIDI
jgi:hypothetical protein